MCGFSQILEWRQKKLFNSRNIYANFHEFRGKPTKKWVFIYYKICEKTVLAHEFQGDNQYLGSLRPWTALQWHLAHYFLWGTILAWGGRILVWGGTSSDLGRHGSGLPPVVSGLLQVYNNLSYCNFVTIAFLLKEILLEIGLLKKWELFEVIKRCPKPFSTICFICENTMFIWLQTIVNPAFAILWHYKRHKFAKILAN